MWSSETWSLLIGFGNENDDGDNDIQSVSIFINIINISDLINLYDL